MASLRRNMNILRRLKPYFSNSDLFTRLNVDNIGTISRCYCTQQTSPSDEIKDEQNTGSKDNISDVERDPFLIFMRSDVQLLLNKLKGYDPEKAFQTFKSKWAFKPKFDLLTDQELQAAQENMSKRGWMRLQMPPFMAERKPRDEILEDDPSIDGAFDHKHVFVDISWKNKRIMGNNHRPITCRHPDGKLKWADWEQVDRVCQMFDPVPGREHVMPKMFEQDHLEKLLAKEEPEYRYILERACVQFEPDSEHFIRVSRRIYEEVAKHNRFNDLWSTRFYGPMVFYFCWIKSIGPLLCYLIKDRRIVNAAILVKLYEIVNPEFQVKSARSTQDIIMHYVVFARQHHLAEWETLETEVAKIRHKKSINSSN